MSSDVSPIVGVSRRDFLKFCGWAAVMIGAGPSAVPEIAAALEKLAKRPQVIWSSFQVCTGCSIQLLESRTPPIAQLILKQISVEYQDNVMAASGRQAEEHLDRIVESGDFYWVVEGSIATKEPGMMTIAGEPSTEIAKKIYPKAKAVLATGNCATFGNIQASRPNPSGAMGLGEYLKGEGITGPPIINMPRCPGQAEDLVAALVYVLVNGKAPALDTQGRPEFLFGTLIHDHCERRGHFEAGEFIETFGDENSEHKEWCWYKLGCKGPQTFAPCPVNRWNGHISWCVNNGPCIGCAEDNFWDDFTPFTERTQALPGLGGLTAQQVGIGLGVATGVGLAAHLIGQGVTGRLRHQPEPEPIHRDERRQ